MNSGQITKRNKTVPDSSLKFKCKRIKCEKWFTFEQADVTKNSEGTSLSIHCPVCAGYVEKIQRVLDGRGNNLEPRDVVRPILAHKPVPPPPSACPWVKLNYLTALHGPPAPVERLPHRREERCGMGQGDKIPKMRRYLDGGRDLMETIALITKKPCKKRATQEWDK